ncbi:hypothetical protein LY78DRAFT_659356 [Colletotrichum sublineola]|nr:hypothetical protein LY78DRAFT_659356 [Colletotrichum sublineola]
MQCPLLLTALGAGFDSIRFREIAAYDLRVEFNEEWRQGARRRETRVASCSNPDEPVAKRDAGKARVKCFGAGAVAVIVLFAFVFALLLLR